MFKYNVNKKLLTVIGSLEMGFGLKLSEFGVGAVIQHKPGKTIFA